MIGRTVIIYPDELVHYGVQGQKWGVRNYQNEDGSYKSGAEGRYYTPVGGVSVRREIRNRYKTAKQNIKAERRQSRDELLAKENKEMLKIERPYRINQKMSDADLQKEREVEEKYTKKWDNNEAKYKKQLRDLKQSYKEEMRKAGGLSDKQKVLVTAGAAAVLAGLTAYGIYKVSKNNAIILERQFNRLRDDGNSWVMDNIKKAKENPLVEDATYGNLYLQDIRNIRKSYDRNLYNRFVKKAKLSEDVIRVSTYDRFLDEIRPGFGTTTFYDSPEQRTRELYNNIYRKEKGLGSTVDKITYK